MDQHLLIKVKDRADRLQRRIDDAPHAVDCDYYCTRSAAIPLPCSCWKSEQ